MLQRIFLRDRNQASFVSSSPVLTLPVTEGEDRPFRVVEVNGLGPVEATTQKLDEGNRSGVYYLGRKQQSRFIEMTIEINPRYELGETVDEAKRALYMFLRAGSQLELYFQKRYFGEILQSSNRVVSYARSTIGTRGVVERVEEDPFSDDTRVKVGIFCPTPEFASPNGTFTRTLNLATGVYTYLDEPFINTEALVPTVRVYPVASGFDTSTRSFGFWVPARFESGVSTLGTVLFSAIPENTTTYLELRPEPREARIGTALHRNITVRNKWPTLEPGRNVFYISRFADVSHVEIIYTPTFGWV